MFNPQEASGQSYFGFAARFLSVTWAWGSAVGPARLAICLSKSPTNRRIRRCQVESFAAYPFVNMADRNFKIGDFWADGNEPGAEAISRVT